jgi:signal peptide peptidase SppA
MSQPNRYERIVRAVMAERWAIQESKFRQIEALLELRVRGGHVDEESIRAIVADSRKAAGGTRQGAVAVIPIFGVIGHRMDLFSEMSGGTSTLGISKAFRQALADPEIGSIVLEVDSPGGAVSGVAELAEEVFAARGQKPVVAVANTLAASAAYWIATQADELVVSPSGEVGSIGVFALLENWQGFFEREGIQHTLVRNGENKAEINDFSAPTPEALAHLQAQVDEVGAVFIKAVARGRNVATSMVRGEFGQGRTFLAKQAVKLGMADRIGTLDEAVARAASLARRRSAAGAAAAMLEPPRLELEVERAVDLEQPAPDRAAADRDRLAVASLRARAVGFNESTTY